VDPGLVKNNERVRLPRSIGVAQVDLHPRLTADPAQVDDLPPVVRQALLLKVKPALLADPFWGDRIARDRWPKRFQDLPNLFRFELPSAHRGVYSVMTHPGLIREIRIVWLGDHKRYDRLFGYSTS
jgi:hypothetical protein